MGVSCSRGGGRLRPDEAQAELEAALRSGDPLRIQFAQRNAQAEYLNSPSAASTSGVVGPVVDSEELQAALRSGDAVRIEQACTQAESLGANPAKLSLARAEARWLRAHSNLQQAVRGSDAQQIDKAYREAEAAGVDAANISRSPDGRYGPPSTGPKTSCLQMLKNQATMGAALGILLYEFAAYNLIFLGKVLPAAGKELLVIPFLILFNASWALAIWSFAQAHGSDPGTIPHRWFEFVRRSGEGLPVAPSRMEWQPGKATMCKRCSMPRPERAHHCHVCNICILRMDHHCPWINNCVGFGNHKFFLQLVGYCLLTSIIALITTFPDLVQCIVNLLSLEQGYEWEAKDMRLMDVIVFLIFGILALIFAGLLGPMLATHLELATHNVTTIEGHYEHVNMPNPFDQGSTNVNLSQIFGAFGPDWFFPVKPFRPLSDGVCFLRSSESLGPDGIPQSFNQADLVAQAGYVGGSPEEALWRMRYQVQNHPRTPRDTSVENNGGLTALTWWWGSQHGAQLDVDDDGRRVISI